MATITNLGFNIHSEWDGSGVREARNDLDRLRADMRMISGAALHIDVVADTDKARAEMQAFREEQDSLSVHVDLDAAQARADMARLKASAGDIGISFDINETSYAETEARIDFLTRDRTINIHVDRDRLRGDLDILTDGFNNTGNAAVQAGEKAEHMGRMMKIAIAVVIASIAVVPALVTAIGAALLTLPGIITVALGGYFLSSIEEVSNAFEELKQTIMDVGVRAAEPMKQPLLDAMKEIRQWVLDNEALFKTMYQNAAQLIDPMVNSLKGFMDNVMPGFNIALRNSVPLFEGFGEGLMNLGGSIGRMFAVMSYSAEAFGETWNIVFTTIGNWMELFGRAAANMAVDANASMSESLGSFTGFLQGAMDGLTGFIHATGQAQGGLGFWQALGDVLREALPAIGELYAAFSSALGPALKELAKPLGELIGEFARSLVPVMVAVAPILLDVAKGFTQVVEWLKPIMPVLGPVIAGIWLLNAALAANPIVLVGIAIAGLVFYLVELENKTKVFSNAWKAVWDKIGEPLTNFWNSAKEIFAQVWDALGPKMTEIWNTFRDAVSDAWNKLKPALIELKDSLQPVWDAMKPILAVLGGAFLATFMLIADIVLNTVVHVIKPIINGLVELIRNVIQLLAGFIKFITGIFETVKGVAEIFVNFIKMVFGIFTGNAELASRALEGVQNGFKDFFTGIGHAIQGIVTMVDSLWDAIYNIFETAIGTVIGIVRGWVGGIIDWFAQLYDVLVGHSIVPDLIKSIIEWFVSLPGKILGMLGDFVGSVIGWFHQMNLKAVAALMNLGSELWDKFRSAFDNVISKIPEMIMKVVNFYRELPGKIVEALGKVGDLGKHLVEGFWEGLKAMGSWLKDKIKNFFTDSVPGAIKSVLGINSPSVVAAELGENTGEGFAIGLDNKQGEVRSSAQDLANQITEVKVPALPMNEVMQDFIKSTGTATDKLDILNGGLSKYRQDLFSAEDVQAKVNSTMQNLTESLVGFNGTMILSSGRIDTGTEAGRKMYDQMKEVVTSFDNAGAAAYQSAIDQGMSMDQAAQAAFNASATIRDSFVRQAIEAGLTNEQAQGLANTYKMFPDDIKTQFMANLDQADSDVKAFMERQRTIAFNYAYSQQEIMDQRAAGGNQAGPVLMPNGTYRAHGGWIGTPGRAEGGWIVGPGSTTSDSILGLDRSTGIPTVHVSNGEFVVNADAAAKNRAALEAMNAGKSMQKLAEGGSIGGAESAASAITATGTAALDAMLQAFSASTVKILLEVQAKWDEFLGKVKTNLDTWVPPFQAKWDEVLTANKTRLDAYSADALATWTTLWQKTTDLSNQSWTNLRAKWDETCSAFKLSTENLRDNVIATWTAFWDNVFTKSTQTWTAMAGKFDEFRAAVVGTVNAIKTQVEETWGGIVEIFKTPVTGVVRIWNDVSGAFGLEQIEGFATGGAINGKGNGTSDDVPARLSAGEHVWTAREVDAAGGHNAIYQMRQDVLRGNRQNIGIGNVGNDNRFAGGGEVRPARLDPTISMAREKGDGRAYVYGGSGPEGFDCSGYMSAIYNSLTGRSLWQRSFSTESDFESLGFAKGLGAGFSVGIMRGGGGPNSHMAGTLDGVNVESGGGHNSTRYGGPAAGADHSQFPIKYFLPIMGGQFVSGGGGSPFAGPSPEQIQKHKDAVAAIRQIMDDTKAGRNSLAATSPAGDLPTFGTDRVGDGAIGKLDAALASASAAMGGTIPEGERRKIIEDAMALTNTPPPSTREAWLAGMNTLIQRESSWQTNSTNNWDSNAAAGNPSGGLTHTTGTTFNAYKVPGYDNMYAAVDNVAASINYIKDVYGTIENVQQANANMPPKGYYNGASNAAAGWSLVGERGPEMVKFSGGEQVKSFNDIINAIKENSTADGNTLYTKMSKDLEALGNKIVGQMQMSDKEMRAGLERILAQAGMEINVPISVSGADMQQIIADLQSQLLPKLEMMIRQGVGARG